MIITGGLGFIGARLAERLATSADAPEVVVLDDVDAGGPYPAAWKRANAARLRALAGVEVREGADARETADALTADALTTARRGGRAGVAHLAARSGLASATLDAAGAVRANVGTTAEVLAAAAAASEDWERVRVVVASSGAVYGDREDARTPSEVGDACDSPTSTYAATKRASELLARVYAEQFGVSVVVARIFTVYGERGRPDMAVWKFIRQLTSGAKLTRFGDGTDTWRDYVHVDDVVDALIRALTCEIDEGSNNYAVVNVAGGKPVFLSELIDACERACGRTGAVEQSPGRPGDVGGTYGDIRATTELLDGWMPRVSLDEGLRRTVEWWRSSAADEYRDP